MLEFLRRSATSVFAWVILGVLALVFGLSFGLPSDSLTFGSQPFVTVFGDPVDDEAYRYQFNLMSRVVRIPEEPRMQALVGVKEEVLEAGIERELLAHEARGLGLDATEWDAETLTLSGHVIVLGDTVDWLGDTAFNYDLFTNSFLRGLQVPEPKYLKIQQDEILARTIRDLFQASAVVPPSQVRRQYEEEANQLSLRYVRFAGEDYAELVDPNPEDIQRYADANRDALKEQYGRQGVRFAKLPKQARLRFIEIAKGEDAKATGARARDAAKRISRGDDFRQVAREVSEHRASARAGGDYGWVNIEGTGSGLDPVVDDALTALEPGQVSEVLSGESSWYVVRVEGRREGDVPEDQAILELAEEALRAERGRELAKQAAQEALLAVEDGKTLADLFESPKALPSDDAAASIESMATGPEKDTRGVPKVRVTGLFGREDPIPGIGAQGDLVKAAWETDDKREVIDRVFETADGYVIAGVERKELATDEGFAERRAEIFRELAAQKARRVLAGWTERQCVQAKANGDIAVSEDKVARLVVYDVKDEAVPAAQPYSPCDRVGMRGGLLRTGLMSQGRSGTE